jgi:hypothetical protein
MTDLMDKARTAVYAALDALNEQLPVERKLKKAPETILLGKAGTLDSVSFIGLIVFVEEKCHDEWGVSVSLSEGLTDNPQPGVDDPFQTVGGFIRYISRQMDSGNP